MKNHKIVKAEGRVIGLDCHPDSFTAAVLRGATPASAIIEQTCNKVPLSRLENWARKHVTPEDQVVLEASGNSFQVVRLLQKVGARAEVLESCHLGKLKEAHANNDKISAVRMGPKPGWPAPPKKSGCPMHKPSSGAIGIMPTPKPSNEPRKCATVCFPA